MLQHPPRRSTQGSGSSDDSVSGPRPSIPVRRTCCANGNPNLITYDDGIENVFERCTGFVRNGERGRDYGGTRMAAGEAVTVVEIQR
jgi:hypothetical protein